MAESDISEPNFSDLSHISGLSQILKNDDSIANRVRDLLEGDESPTKPILLQGLDSEETMNGASAQMSNETETPENEVEAVKNMENEEDDTEMKQLVQEITSNDDMLSISGATEYQDLPDVSGNSTGKKVMEETPQVPAKFEEENVNSAESIAKIAGTVKYYLESDPNTPQLVAEEEKLNNLMKYMEGDKEEHPVSHSKETPPLLLQKNDDRSLNEEETPKSSNGSEKSDIQVSPLPVKREVWGAESVSSVEDNLTERVRKTLEGRESPTFKTVPVESTVSTDVVLNPKAYFSLPTSPCQADQSVESVDSLANHVKSLLTTRPKSASPFSMLHHTDREQLKTPNKAPQDLRSSFSGNLSQEIRNFENTDLWRFARQFMPGEKPSHAPPTGLPKNVETPNSSSFNLDTSNASQTPSVTNILKRIRDTTLHSDKDFESSVNQSPDDKSKRSVRCSPPRHSLKLSPSKIPVSKSYQSSKSPLQLHEKKSRVIEEYKKKSPTPGARPPFRRIFPTKPDSYYSLNHETSFSTPLQTKIDSIDRMNTSSLLKYKVDFPSTTVTPFQLKSFNNGKQKNGISSAPASHERLTLEKQLLSKSSEFKIPTGLSTLEFPRSSYLREKIGLKPLKKKPSKPDVSSTMQQLQGEICEATPLPSKEKPVSSKEDFVFCTPKVSAQPPCQTKQRLHSPDNKPVTILPTYDQLVVHDSLKQLKDNKEAECLHYSLSDTNTNVAVTQSTPLSTNVVNTSYSRPNYSTPRISLFEDSQKRSESDHNMQRRTLSTTEERMVASPQLVNNEVTTHSLKPSMSEDASRLSFQQPVTNIEEVAPVEMVKSVQEPVRVVSKGPPQEVIVPDSPPLPYVRLKQDAPKATQPKHIPPPTVRSISTKKVQSILMKEKEQSQQIKQPKASPQQPRKNTSGSLNTSDPNVVLKKDLESLLNLFEEKAPIITEILKRIHDSSVQKQNVASSSSKVNKEAAKKSQSTQTVTEEDVEVYEAGNTAREVACQTGTALKSMPKERILPVQKENILTPTMGFENRYEKEDVAVKQTKTRAEKPTSFFVEVENRKEKPVRDSDVAKSSPVAWFEPFQYEPPWMHKENKPSYGYVNANVQDAFLENKRDFVLRSWERQEDIQIRAEQRKIQEIEENIKQRFEEMQKANMQRQTVVREPHFEKSKPSFQLPTKQTKKKDTTFKELFAKSRKAYLNLPEVKSQREKQKRVDFYRENRLKAQAYKSKVQKSVLNKNKS